MTLRQRFRGLGARLLAFLEIIGLRETPVVDFDSRLAELRLRYHRFRDLLAANNDLLEIISTIEFRLQRGTPVTSTWVRSRALAAVTRAHRMATGLNAVSGGRYPAVQLALDRIQRNIAGSKVMAAPAPVEGWVLPVERLDRSMVDLAGSKMATLGEAASALGLRVPRGFVVTVAAFHRLLEAAGGPGPAHEGCDANGMPRARPDRSHTQRRLLDTAVPEELAAQILAAHARLAVHGEPPALAVRSSAVDEDTEASFAGQYLTELNVGPEGVVEAYRRVAASTFAPVVQCYRHEMGFDESDLGMAVGCLELVDAVASGVAFSSDPVGLHPDCVLIHGVWGLGPSLVEGGADPDVFLVSRLDGRVTVSVSRKPARLVAAAGGGLVAEPVPDDEQLRPSLDPAEASRLAEWAIRLERHFGAPQDVEWALDRERRLVLLQSRPAMSRRSAESDDDGQSDGEGDPIIEGGQMACPGAGAGPVVVAMAGESLDAFPEGGVLVAPKSSPAFVQVMRRASAIVTEVGSAIGHMASLTREFGVPTLVGVSRASEVLPAGTTVTVDATRRRVYAGRREALLARRQRPAPGGAPAGAAQARLAEVAAYIVPLTLTDPRDDAFTPIACRTLHDLARYIHERSFQEMFQIGALVGDARNLTPMLDVFLPIDLYVVDLGGGLSAGPGARTVRRGEITSAPFAALLDGMLHPAIPRFGPRGLDARGLLDVVLRQAIAHPDDDRTLRDPCFAIVSDRYVNLSARVGFHFSAVDAYCVEAPDQNAVAFRWKGGASDLPRRQRRVEAIGAILRHHGFVTDVRADLVVAQFRKRDRAATLQALEMLGQLLQFMRQMDAAMGSDGMVGAVVDDFLSGRFGRPGTRANDQG